jgi:putative mRNA 3-end processing factor
MRISFQHANPQAGNESCLLRFRALGQETACVLVDAGHGTDVDALLGSDDRLDAICLTHAHLDHYAELTAAHREGVPIFTSPGTARVLDDVFDVAGTEYGVETTAGVRDAITPVESWTEITPDVDIHPVPAGHTPGAAGFLVRVEDGNQTHRLLSTGDFTRRRVAGFPGFPATEFGDVDALFLTGSTNEEFEASITEALGTAIEHAHGGSKTLVTTSGIVGVHVAYLLAGVATEYDLRVPVRVVGQVAKLYEELEYNCPGVEVVRQFRDTSECLEPGVVTVAGPEIPHERSSGRLFGVLKEDPNACVVQLVGSGADAKTDARCTIHDYELVNHPRRETLTAVHDAVDPTETVIVHQHRGAKGAFNDLGSVVWGAGDTTEYTLYDGHEWKLPPWMNGGAVLNGHDAGGDGDAGGDNGDLSVPPMARHDHIDLEAEGVDTERLARMLHQDPKAASSIDAPDSTAPSSSASDSTTPSVTTDGAGSTGSDSKTPDAQTTVDDGAAEAGDVGDAGEPESEIVAGDGRDTSTGPKENGETSGEGSREPTTPIQTTGADPSEEPDPMVERALAANDMTREEFLTVLEAKQEAVEEDSEDDGSGERDGEKDGNEDGEKADDGGDEADDENAEADDENAEADDENAEADDENAEADDENAEANGGSDPEDSDEAEDSDAEQADGNETTEDESGAGEETEVDAGAEDTERDEATTDSSESTAEATTTQDTTTLELNPLAVALARRHADGVSEETDTGGGDTASDAASDEPVELDGFVRDAVSAYLLALLDGTATGDDEERLTVTLDASPAVERALAATLADDLDSTTDLATHVASLFDGTLTDRVAVRDFSQYREQTDAVVRNDAYSFADTADVVEAAILWAVDE